MPKENLTFNDLPQVVAQLRDEVMGMRAMLSKQQAESSKPVKENRHKPMTVEEAIEYTHIPKGTLPRTNVSRTSMTGRRKLMPFRRNPFSSPIQIKFKSHY